MRGTIKFDYESDRFAIEIHDIIANHLLAPEVQTTEPISSQRAP